jgi:hypothetical protein
MKYCKLFHVSINYIEDICLFLWKFHRVSLKKTTVFYTNGVTTSYILFLKFTRTEDAIIRLLWMIWKKSKKNRDDVWWLVCWINWFKFCLFDYVWILSCLSISALLCSKQAWLCRKLQQILKWGTTSRKSWKKYYVHWNV